MRQKQSVQTAKITPQTTYAINDDEKLKRFYVQAVVTRRVNNYNNPHDYQTTVEGYIVKEDGGDKTVVELPAARLLGLFEEHVELVERQNAEKAAFAAKRQALIDAASDLRTLLYQRTATPPPNDERSWAQPFRENHSTGLTLSEDGVRLLTQLLKEEPKS